MRLRGVVILVLLLLFVIVIAQNAKVVTVRLLFWDLEMSRIVLLALTLAVGVVVGFLLGRPWRRRRGSAVASRPSDADRTPGSNTT